MGTQFNYPEMDAGKNYRKEENGWIFVRVEGSPRVRGYFYGMIMADEIISAVKDAKSLVEVQTGVSWDFFLSDGSSILPKWKKHLQTPPYDEF